MPEIRYKYFIPDKFVVFSMIIYIGTKNKCGVDQILIQLFRKQMLVFCFTLLRHENIDLIVTHSTSA